MNGRPDALQPEALAGRMLYEPLGDLLRASGDRLPSLARLNGLIGAHRTAPVNGQGLPVRFVPPGHQDVPYEHAVFSTGEVATRADNWHDYFNALVWAIFPRAKAALNARHMHELTRAKADGSRARGAVRDALTQFDECGMVVVGDSPELLDALARHQWDAVLWGARKRLMRATRFVLFGHASYDQLRAPFNGLCAKVLYLAAPGDVLARPLSTLLRSLDDWLAGFFGDVRASLSPAAFAPLPLLGIPGVVQDSALRSYYADTRQFRPLGDRAPVPVHHWSGELAEAL
ncbi:MAG: DUF3025 domain-containing protein [Rhodocyclaceae bacterium]|nr:DUF3025 domain-containing protein [Rhodocyclaceae bacterium]